MDTDLHWTCQPFHQLGVEQLYAILALRDQVFVLEQQSLYGDVDGLDIDSHHVCAWHPTAGLVAYARLLPPDLKYPHCAAIGRVVIAPAWRHLGLGKNCLPMPSQKQYRYGHDKILCSQHNMTNVGYMLNLALSHRVNFLTMVAYCIKPCCANQFKILFCVKLGRNPRKITGD